MKFVNLAIGSILFLQALALLYSPTQRYNFHSFVGLVKDQWQQCSWLQSICFQCTEKLRLFAVALIFTGSLSLSLCDNLLVGFFAQLIWTVTQNESYYSTGMNETKNTLIQVVLTVFLLGSVFSQRNKSDKSKTSLQNTVKLNTEPSASKVAETLKKQSSQIEKKSQPTKKQQQKQKQSPQKAKPKSKKKI